MKLIAAHVFEARGIGRAAEESSEVLDPLHVVMLGLRRELADRHVFDHAPPQRAYGLIGHEGCSCLGEGCEPLISRQDAPWRYRVGCVAGSRKLPRERFSPLARSGHSSAKEAPGLVNHHERTGALIGSRQSSWRLIQANIAGRTFATQ